MCDECDVINWINFNYLSLLCELRTKNELRTQFEIEREFDDADRKFESGTSKLARIDCRHKMGQGWLFGQKSTGWLFLMKSQNLFSEENLTKRMSPRRSERRI